MKKSNIIYWTSTGIISLMMVYSAIQYMVNPDISAGFTHLGFPGYFRIELAIAKIIGAILLIIPFIQQRFKEWAYAGFIIVFISAFVSHVSSGDAMSHAISPLVMLGILMLSYYYYNKRLALKKI